MTTKSKKRKLLLLLWLVPLFLLCWILATFVTFYTNPADISDFSFTALWQAARSSLTIIITLVFFVLLVAFITWNLFKREYFSFRKTINRVDRAESDLHGAAKLLTPTELKEKFGDVAFKDLAESDLHGILVRTEKKNGQLYCSAVKNMTGVGVGTNGTGKSWYCLNPTIQANARSKTKPTMIINDMKGELYRENSALLAQQGYNVVCLNMRIPRSSVRFNPLSFIWWLYHEYIRTGNNELLDKASEQIVEISEIICPTGTGDNKTWTEGAQGIIAGILWGMLEDSLVPAYRMTEDKFTLTQISNIVNKQREMFMDFLSHRSNKSRVFDYAGMIIANESEKTVASYLSTLQTSIKPFLDTGIQYLTSASDFDIKTLTSDKPTAVFLVIPDENPTRWVLSTLIISQLYNFLTFTASQRPSLKLDRVVYFLLDEFANLPKVPRFANWVSLSRGRNMFFFVLIQAISQLKSTYGDNDTDTILQNCHLKVFLGANEMSSYKYFQELFGSYTVYQRSANITAQTLEHVDYAGSTGMTKKDIVTIDELQYIKKGTLYFIVNTEAPAKSNYVPLFDEELNKNGTFVRGALEQIIKEKKIDLDATFYNVEDRDAQHMFMVNMPQDSAGNDTTGAEGDDDDLYIVETTDLYNIPIDEDYSQIRTFDFAALNTSQQTNSNVADEFIKRLKRKVKGDK